jgi:hypothetical protein
MNDDIVTIRRHFCAAMQVLCTANASVNELSMAWSGREADVYKMDILLGMQKEWAQGVYRRYCIEWSNPKREPGEGSELDYHPDYFDILEISVKGKKATAKVSQPQLSYNPRKGPGIFPIDVGLDFMVYHLRFTESGWRLEDRRESHHRDGRVFKMGL